ncbi:hypothetical protein FQR65_LT20824 [Abscondita terminalis]|nr:hypothetical protein FQR65_LT20824 [Abscondita terminalis]
MGTDRCNDARLAHGLLRRWTKVPHLAAVPEPAPQPVRALRCPARSWFAAQALAAASSRHPSLGPAARCSCRLRRQPRRQVRQTGTRGQCHDQAHDDVLPHVHALLSASASASATPVGDEAGQVGQREQVAGHQQRIAPAVGLAPHGRQRGNALGREHEPGQQRQRRRQRPAVGDQRAQLLGHGLVTGGGQRIDRAHGADGHLARGHAGDQGDGDLPVEADGGQHHLQPAADAACEAEPQHDAHGQDDAAHAAQEDHGALVQAQGQAARAGPAVGRQLHQQRRGAGAAAGQLCHACHGHGADDAGHIQREQHQALQVEDTAHGALGNEGADQQRIDRQACRAGHQRRDHDGHQPVAPAGDGARGHDAGHGAGKAGQQRDEGATRQPHLAHDPVQQEGRARQIARVLQREDEEEQDQDLRQEHQHAARARDDAVGQQAAQRALGHVLVDQGRHGRYAALDAIHQWLRPAEHGLEHQEQRGRQQQHAPQRVQHHGVDAVVAPGVHHGFLHAGGHDAGHLLVQCQHLFARIALRGLRHGRRGQGARLGPVQPLQQFARAVLAHAHGGQHRHAQGVRQGLAVDGDALAPGHVAHVEHQQHGQAQAPRLQHQAQVQAQVGGIGDADQQFGRRLARMPARDDVARDALVLAVRMQAVGARQVQNTHTPAAGRIQPALLALHGDARVVGHLLSRTGQQVEQSGLAAVGVAQQGQAQRRRIPPPRPLAGCRWLDGAWGRRLQCSLRPLRRDLHQRGFVAAQ